MHHDCHSLLKFNDCVHVVEIDRVEGVAGSDAVDDKLVTIDFNGMRRIDRLKEERNVEVVDAGGTLVEFLIESVDDGFCDHNCSVW